MHAAAVGCFSLYPFSFVYGQSHETREFAYPPVYSSAHCPDKALKVLPREVGACHSAESPSVVNPKSLVLATASRITTSDLIFSSLHDSNITGPHSLGVFFPPRRSMLIQFIWCHTFKLPTVKRHLVRYHTSHFSDELSCILELLLAWIGYTRRCAHFGSMEGVVLLSSFFDSFVFFSLALILGAYSCYSPNIYMGQEVPWLMQDTLYTH
ncbi:hypothetical protein BX600DRAFT_189321 [Xylariales sp. PMI_506]|nr:hypothetical protein BX600DRAFT_189321 [Xylariales sp. PMI_506]